MKHRVSYDTEIENDSNQQVMKIVLCSTKLNTPFILLINTKGNGYFYKGSNPVRNGSASLTNRDLLEKERIKFADREATRKS